MSEPDAEVADLSDPGGALALPSRTRGFAVALVATLVMTTSYVDRQALAALAPTVRPALHLTQTEYGWLTSAFSFSYLAFAPFAGALLDRVGARRGIVWAVLAWSAVSAGHALVPGFAALFVARALLGMTESPSFPAAAQTVRRVLHPRDHSIGYGFIFTGSSLGAMVAAPLAIALASRFGWRSSFLLTAAAGLSWVPLWLIVTRHPAVRARFRDADAQPRPKLERADVSAIAQAVVLVLAAAPVMMFVLNWYPQVLASEFGVPQAKIGHYVWAPALAMDLGSVGFGVLASRRDRTAAATGRPSNKRDLVAFAAALATLIAAVPFVGDPIRATAVGAVATLGGGALYSLLTGEMMARLPMRRVAAAGGVCASAQSIAHIVAAPLVGRSIDATHGYTTAMVALGVLVIPGALAWIAWPRGRTPSRA